MKLNLCKREFVFLPKDANLYCTQLAGHGGPCTFPSRAKVVEVLVADDAAFTKNVTVVPIIPASAAPITMQMDAPPCDTCGDLMVRNGSCYRCHTCGTTSGCS